MAKKKDNHPGVPAESLQLRDAGIPEKHHDEVLALKAPALARGLDWVAIVEAIGEASRNAPAIIDFLKKILGKDGAAPPAA